MPLFSPARSGRFDALARGRSADAHPALYLDLLGLLPRPKDQPVCRRSRSRCLRIAGRTDFGLAHYGERWGRHWLDQARYADSNGYAIDAERQMWPFRDWVIRAERRYAFDRFTIEQLAGDLLPEPKKEQLLATAFHRNTLINQEGGSDPEQFRVEAVMDRVNTTGAVWLGLTVGCAQCHSHKFDPITQARILPVAGLFQFQRRRQQPGADRGVHARRIDWAPPGPRPEPPPAIPRRWPSGAPLGSAKELSRLEIWVGPPLSPFG